MRIIILSAIFVLSFAANDNSNPKSIETELNSQKLKDDLHSIPTSYDFKYSTGQEGPAQLFREEHRDHDGTVRGKYGYVDPYGKLRVVEYSAGANGYSASGDIGTDSDAQNKAQLAQGNDPSVRAQADVWSRSQTNLGSNPNWGSQPLGWSSVDPLWNVGALPQLPVARPALTVSQPVPQSVPQPSRRAPVDRVWEEKAQNNWENSNSNDNNWQKSQQNSPSVDWNTWNSDQQKWTKQKGTGASQQWTSSIDHEWPQKDVNRGQLNNYWSNQPTATQPQGVDRWVSPKQDGVTSDQWSGVPQNPTTGQWTQFDDNRNPNEWSNPKPVSQPSPSTLPDLKEKWTGISTGAQITSDDKYSNKPLAGPPPVRPQAPEWPQRQSQQQPSPIQWGQPAPTFSIADQWAKRQSQGQPIQFLGGQGQVGGQPQSPTSSDNRWQSGVQYDNQPNPQNPSTPSKESRIGEQLPRSQPQDQSVSNWQQPNQAQFDVSAVQPIAPQNIGYNQWSSGQSDNIFGGQPYVHFRIDHTLDPNQPPLRYQYSY